VRRADRLFLIIHTLRGRKSTTTARRLADELGVSPRTVYRDVADLQLAGVPIEGAAGLGYTLRRGADVPPLMFTRAELEALVVGSRLTQAFAGRRVAEAARHALTKIEAVLPEDARKRRERSRIIAPPVRSRAAVQERLDLLHAAIDARCVVRLVYAAPEREAQARDVEPLSLAFWGGVWTLGGWCRLRAGFRNFRVDRMVELEPTGETFPDDPARGLAAYFDEMGVDAESFV
jgi:predicted DNA-binding transcriptional regulator YafY